MGESRLEKHASLDTDFGGGIGSVREGAVSRLRKLAQGL